MSLNIKAFETLGMVTLVTPPSMMNPEKISFTLVNLKENEKNYFAKELNKLFPNDNVVVYIYNLSGEKGWINLAMSKSKYILINKDSPVWVSELAPESKTYFIDQEQSVEKAFENCRTTLIYISFKLRKIRRYFSETGF